MQINSIDELSGWMHKTVDMVRRVTGDEASMALNLEIWDHRQSNGGSDRSFEVSVWFDSRKEHIKFKSIDELEKEMALKLLLLKRFT